MSRRRGVLADSRLSPLARDLARSLDLRIAGADGGRLGRGLALAGRPGSVSGLEAKRGVIRARVAGSSGDGYRVTVRYPVFDRFELLAWEYVTGQAGYGPEVEPGEYSREMLLFAEEAGSPIVPAPGDLDTACDCPDPMPVCKHIIAVLKTLVAEVDRSGSILLLARGIKVTEPAPPEAVPENAGRTRWAATAFDDGLVPAEAFAKARGPFPEAPATPEEPNPPCFHAGPWDPGRFTPEITADRLDVQAAIAANAAFAALDAVDRGRPLPPRPDDPALDAARVAVLALDQLPALAPLAGCPPQELEGRGFAWLYGGPEGVAVVAEQWKPDAARCREVDERFAEALGGANRRQNRWTFTDRGFQLRLGRDGRWYPFAKDGSRWRPATPPRSDLDDAVRWIETGAAAPHR